MWEDIKEGWQMFLQDWGMKDLKKSLTEEIQGSIISIVTGKKTEVKLSEDPLPPKSCFNKTGIPFGSVNRKVVRFPAKDYRQKLVLGAPGVGKTEWAKMFVLNCNTGVCFLDNADGEAVDDILRALPEERLKKTILLDHSDKHYPLPMGMYLSNTGDVFADDDITNGWIDFFESNFDVGEQYMTIELIGNACRAVFSQGGTLLDVVRMIQDQSYRSFIIKRCDPSLAEWWYAFESKSPGEQERICASFLRRTGVLFRDRVIKYTLGIKRELNYRKWIDEGYTVLIKAPQSLGRELVRIIMSLHAICFWQASLSRDNIPQNQRKSFWLIADEPQTWLSKNENVLDNIFSKARKYGLRMICLFQSTKQVSKESPSLLRIILDTQPHILAFNTGGGQIDLDPFDPEELPNYTFIAKLENTFIAKSLGTVKGEYDRVNFIQEQRAKFNLHYLEAEAKTCGGISTKGMTCVSQKSGLAASVSPNCAKRTNTSLSTSTLID